MDSKAIERWKKIKSKGKARYIIVGSVIGWGIPVGLIATFLNVAFDAGFSLKYIASLSFVYDLLITLAVFMLAGIPFGFSMWKYMERTYDGKGKKKKK